MAQIVINEISQNYSYNIGTNSYACVALPITSCWGPGYFDPETYFDSDPSSGQSHDHSGGVDLHQLMLDETSWTQFPATQRGLEAFVAAYRGPQSTWRLSKDYSYQMAVTLLTAGYDVLVCRISSGIRAEGQLTVSISGEDPNTGETIDPIEGTVTVKAKYPGTFGNKLLVTLIPQSYVSVDASNKRVYCRYWNLVVYVVDSSGIKTAVENLVFVSEPQNATDNILYWRELESNFLDICAIDGLKDVMTNSAEVSPVMLTGGSDNSESIPSDEDIIKLAKDRYGDDGDAPVPNGYIATLAAVLPELESGSIEKSIIYNREWTYTKLVGYKQVLGVFDLLKDKLSYNPNRIMTAGWDDQNICELLGDSSELHPIQEFVISPMHKKLMDVAYYSRCATSFVDIPKSLNREGVHIEEGPVEGYAQMLARYIPDNAALDVNGGLYQTHSALFAPWGKYQYVGTGKQFDACPSFQALLIQRAQILNQSIQYEWALPTNRKHSLRLGKLAYNVPKKYLDHWQKLDGVSVNVITKIPDLGVNLWGNSTLFEVPPATYQALANLSTRYLVNAVENVAYRCGLSITFQYNNEQAYNKFYAGVTPLLDTMKNVGAIEGYRVTMSADINGLDQVNANTVIGKIWLLVNGVINDIYVDLIALPAGAGIDLDTLS